MDDLYKCMLRTDRGDFFEIDNMTIHDLNEYAEFDGALFRTALP